MMNSSSGEYQTNISSFASSKLTTLTKFRFGRADMQCKKNVIRELAFIYWSSDNLRKVMRDLMK